MKSSQAASIALALLVSIQLGSARDAALRYKFVAGQTNAYAVEISVRSETGSETSSGNIILVTTAVTTNTVTLACRGSLKSEIKRSPAHGPGVFSPGFFPGSMMQQVFVFPNDCEIELDLQGNEIRDGGDYVLAVPLGKLVQALFAPLPANSGNREERDKVAVLDDPFWLGPADNFLNVRQNGQPLSMNYFYMGGQRNPFATLLVTRQTTWQPKNSTTELAELHQQSKLESLAQTGGEPRLVANSDTDLTFDRNSGVYSRIETQADVSSQTETSSRHAKVGFKSRLLTGEELAAVLAPPPPAPPRNLSGANLEKMVADLKSSDLDTRRAAIRQLNGTDIDSPSAEVLELIGTMALDTDTFVRMTAANFISNHATTNQVPILLKFLKGSDWSARQPAVKALGRLNDPRAAQPLADVLARNGNMSSQDVSAALINLGVRAEKAVLGLLNDRNVETLRQACAILQQIGTNDSLDALQKLVADDEQSVSQAAADAIRAIKQRQ